ncbi:MAG: hypothetical protein A2144_05635 [Chloroflexi bacterium RBG_16_50_9]|nr:MAG: hypothetical protein A2144_05635 [Chloroflexi bacterium RBG_16_50_9]
MKAFKGFGVGILSFLLFLSLSVFGIAFMVNNTLFNPDFVVTEVDNIEISTLIRELTEEQIGSQLPQDAIFLKEAAYQVISDQEPWLKEQLNTAIYTTYDFLLGRSAGLDVAISLEPLKASLKDALQQAFMQNLPSQLTGLPPAELRLYFDEYYQQIAEQIPSQFQLGESNLPPEAMAQMRLARQYIGYFQTYYFALIGLMVLLIAGIVLINRNIKDATRGLGINFMIYGALEFAGIYVARNYAPVNLMVTDLPPSLQTWLASVYGDLLAPLQIFSLGLFVAGVVLLAVSIIYQPRVTEE